MTAETKTCQNCKASFVIEPEDSAFYEHLDIPPPTFCRECRLRRRMVFRNERALYKRKCDAPGHTEEIISVFSPDKPYRVYDQKAWWGDAWNPLDYGRAIDFTKPFLEQVKALWREVPDITLLNISSVNSDYCNITEGNKNCYLVVGGDFNEDCLCSAFVFGSKECVDTYWVSKSELNYETVDCIQCSRLLWSRYCEGCYDSAFLFNCKNCHDCFCCANLTSKAYHIFNVPYSKEEYARKIREFNLGSRSAVSDIAERFKEHSLKYPRKFARTLHAVRAIGDNLEEAKNCRWCFDTFGGAEDCAYIWLSYSSVKNCFDCDHFGQKSDNSCDSSIVYPGSRVFFSRLVVEGHHIQYSYNCHNVSYLFGCVGLRNKQYCILNRQYTKDEYEALVPKLIAHMNAMPYVDANGRIYAYGEFFPAEFSPFAYNESIAQEYYPLGKDQALAAGYGWKEPEAKAHAVTVKPDDLPDDIRDVKDDVLEAVIGCAHAGSCAHQCTAAFKIIPAELAFYRRMNVPLPRLCPNCRHYARTNQRNPPRLWERSCACGGAASRNEAYANAASHDHGHDACANAFMTSYAPDRPEIVYCGQCYQAEVA